MAALKSEPTDTRSTTAGGREYAEQALMCGDSCRAWDGVQGIPARRGGDTGQQQVPLQDSLYEGGVTALDVLHIQLDGSCNVAQPFQQIGLRIIHPKALTVWQACLNPTLENKVRHI